MDDIESDHSTNSDMSENISGSPPKNDVQSVLSNPYQ